jgi:hypothetical protein
VPDRRVQRLRLASGQLRSGLRSGASPQQTARCACRRVQPERGADDTTAARWHCHCSSNAGRRSVTQACCGLADLCSRIHTGGTLQLGTAARQGDGSERPKAGVPPPGPRANRAYSELFLLTYCTKVCRPYIFLNRTGAAHVFLELLF